ncbi:glycosyltransferase family 4 protein [Priestia aryabhattai]|uniref:glycosyltransferase family 4 protein n=1 Tax=Priestia aryabhattai TaxID=412384 RepID=UPI003D7F9A71
MKVAISMIVTCDKKIDRKELIRDLKEQNYEVVYIGQESKNTINPDFEELGVEFLSIPVGRNNINPFNEIKSLLAAKKVMQDNNIDTLLAYGIKTFPTMAIGAKLAGIKKIICIVNGSGRLFQLAGVKGKIVKLISYPMLWLAFLFSSHIFFQNQDDLKMLRKKKLLPRNNYNTINGSGVNLDTYELQEMVHKPVFLMLSRLTGSKGVNEYIEAAIQIKRLYPESVFYLVGPMDDQEESINKERLHKAVSEGVIKLKGKVENVASYIQLCKVFVLPSYYPEGIPRSILEAMAMGRPILTTNSPGCRETVEHGENGFLVEPRNSQDLVEKMKWFIENDAKIPEMGKRSREICEERFDVNKVNKTIIDEI